MVALLFLILQRPLPPPAVGFCYIQKVTTSLRCEYSTHHTSCIPLRKSDICCLVSHLQELRRLWHVSCELTLIIALEVMRKRVARSLTAFTLSVLSALPRKSSSSLRERWRAAPCFPISSLQVLRSSSFPARVLSTPWVRARSSWGPGPSSPESSSHKEEESVQAASFTKMLLKVIASEQYRSLWWWKQMYSQQSVKNQYLIRHFKYCKWEWGNVGGERLEEDNNTSHPDPPHPFLHKTGKLWMNTVALET